MQNELCHGRLPEVTAGGVAGNRVRASVGLSA